MGEIVELRTSEEIHAAHPVMAELRPHQTPASFYELYLEMNAGQGYRLYAWREGGQIQALMGARFYTDLVRGRHLYIDDLVTHSSLRSSGLGKKMLEFAEGLCRENRCTSLRLAAVFENTLGKKFYEREGWTARGYQFSKSLSV